MRGRRRRFNNGRRPIGSAIYCLPFWEIGKFLKEGKAFRKRSLSFSELCLKFEAGVEADLGFVASALLLAPEVFLLLCRFDFFLKGFYVGRRGRGRFFQFSCKMPGILGSHPEKKIGVESSGVRR